MTVASMPIWSALTAFISSEKRPRHILPPPMTTPTCTPMPASSAMTRATSSTRRASKVGLLAPSGFSGARVSPLSLSMMRLYMRSTPPFMP